MIIQAANIVSGFMLAAPKLKEFGPKEHIESAEGHLRAYQVTIGLIELALGAITLLDRLSYGIHFYSLGSSYPQALVAIAMGLLLSASYFEKYPKVHGWIAMLRPYAVWIGILGIAVGLGSMLFGCFVPGFCGGFGYAPVYYE